MTVQPRAPSVGDRSPCQGWARRGAALRRGAPSWRSLSERFPRREGPGSRRWDALAPRAESLSAHQARSGGSATDPGGTAAPAEVPPERACTHRPRPLSPGRTASRTPLRQAHSRSRSGALGQHRPKPPHHQRLPGTQKPMGTAAPRAPLPAPSGAGSRHLTSRLGPESCWQKLQRRRRRMPRRLAHAP